jgi:serine kinase of HPr protein (carbohydrate metabolism regulator)
VTQRHNIHATGLVLDKTGLILRGPSGSGKSLLALSLLDEWEIRGLPASLVSDDRVDIAVEGGGLVMYPPKPIEGLIELRGRGLVGRPFAARAPVHLVIDFVDTLERMLEEDALETELFGLRLARCPLPKDGVIDSRHQLLLVREAIRALSTKKRPTRQKST